MRRNGTVNASACVLAVAAILAAVPTAVRAESFDARWTAMEAAPKGDRLHIGEQPSNSKIIFINDPRGRMTVAQKVTEVRAPAEKSPVRTVPNLPVRNAPEEKAGKAKDVMDGCEPSFSPVTMPSMANVAGRCIAAVEPLSKVASLAR